jgi:hypothetical protein
MSFILGNSRRLCYFVKYAKLGLWLALVPGALIFPVAAIAGESDEVSYLRFPGSAELYADYQQKVHNDTGKTESGAVQQIPDQKPCYCDVRKQKQVEIRMRKDIVRGNHLLD